MQLLFCYSKLYFVFVCLFVFSSYLHPACDLPFLKGVGRSSSLRPRPWYILVCRSDSIALYKYLASSQRHSMLPLCQGALSALKLACLERVARVRGCCRPKLLHLLAVGFNCCLVAGKQHSPPLLPLKLSDGEYLMESQKPLLLWHRGRDAAGSTSCVHLQVPHPFLMHFLWCFKMGVCWLGHIVFVPWSKGKGWDFLDFYLLPLLAVFFLQSHAPE